MKQLLIILSLLFTSVSWSKNLNYNDLVLRDGVYYKKFSNIPFTGKVKGKQQGRMKKGKKYGDWLEFFNTGQLSGKGKYEEGEKEGFWIFYFNVRGTEIYPPGGNMSQKGYYKLGVKVGEWEYFRHGESIYSKGVYNENGKKNGRWLIFDTNGVITSDETYSNGKFLRFNNKNIKRN